MFMVYGIFFTIGLFIVACSENNSVIQHGVISYSGKISDDSIPTGLGHMEISSKLGLDSINGYFSGWESCQKGKLTINRKGCEDEHGYAVSQLVFDGSIQINGVGCYTLSDGVLNMFLTSGDSFKSKIHKVVIQYDDSLGYTYEAPIILSKDFKTKDKLILKYIDDVNILRFKFINESSSLRVSFLYKKIDQETIKEYFRDGSFKKTFSDGSIIYALFDNYDNDELNTRLLDSLQYSDINIAPEHPYVFPNGQKFFGSARIVNGPVNMTQKDYWNSLDSLFVIKMHDGILVTLDNDTTEYHNWKKVTLSEYDKLCKKYGKIYVDNLKNKKNILIGTPEELFLKFYPKAEIHYNSVDINKYYIYGSHISYYGDSYEINNHALLFSVTTEKGIVTSVYYYR